MRKELEKLDGQRDLFMAKFVRYGSKTGYKGAAATVTILFQDVRRVSDKKLMTDHLWLNETQALSKLQFAEGTQIQFAARVKKYSKGYKGKKEEINKQTRQDYRLSHPTKVEIVEENSKKKDVGNGIIIRKATS